MAISQESLSSKFQTNLKSFFGNPTGDSQMFVDFCDMMAKSVVDEMNENLAADVNEGDLTLIPTGLLDSVGGAVTGTTDLISGEIPAGRFK
jgi:hypothetical protein